MLIMKLLIRKLFFSQEDDIETAVGFMHVVVQGDPKRPPILTYHDIGLNSKLSDAPKYLLYTKYCTVL